jgi:putative FmdB family regulatory protein
MPLYEYQCSKCGKVFEIIQKFSDAALETHDGCGGRVERLLSTPALQFKGSGWYVTDYARGSSSKSSESESGKDSKEAKPAETKTGSKPAATESKSGSDNLKT